MTISISPPNIRPAAPTFGDVYRAYPKGALAIYHQRNGTRIFLVIIDRSSEQNPICQPSLLRTEHTGGAYVEYFQTEAEDSTGASLDQILGRKPDKYRPGVLCGLFGNSERSVLAPSFGQVIPDNLSALPSLEVALDPHPAERTNDCRFELWSMWGCDCEDLIYSTRSVSPNDAFTLRALTLAVLGLSSPTWKPFLESPTALRQAERSASVRRGEVLLVKLPPSNIYHPFIAIGHDAINGASPNQNRIVALQTIDYSDWHEEEGFEDFVPLHTNGNVKSNSGLLIENSLFTKRPLSVQTSLVRGIRLMIGRNTVRTGIFVSSSVIAAINSALEKAYG